MALKLNNLPKSNTNEVDVQEALKLVQQMASTLGQPTTPTKPDEFKGMKYEAKAALGDEFNRCKEEDFNQDDRWFEHHLLFSNRSDGGLNFVAAIDDKTKRIIMLPLSNAGVTKLNPEAPNLLPDNYIEKIISSCKPDSELPQMNGCKSMGILKEIFPKFALSEATNCGNYGESWEVYDKDGNPNWVLRDGKARLGKRDIPIEPLEAFANNIYKCYRTKSNTFSMENIKVYSTNKDELAIKHLDLDSICKKGDWSTWKEYLEARSITGEKMKLLMGLIWAIYDDNFTSRQAIYWYDPNGYSGKSVALKALSKPLLEIDGYGVYNESNTNNFTNERLWDKRLLVVPDNKNPKFVKYGRFHQLTGGDAVDVDSKHKKGFTVHPNAKIFGIGNILPEIDTDARHEYSRIAVFTTQLSLEYYNKHIKHSDGTMGDPDFGKKLEDELYAFLYECRKVAYEINPKRGDFNVDILDEEIKKCSEPKLLFFADFIADKLEFGESYTTSIKDLYIRYENYKKANPDSWNSMGRPEAEDLKEHLSKVLEPNRVSYGRVIHGGKYGFRGFRLKDNTPQTQTSNNTVDEAELKAAEFMNRMKNRNTNKETEEVNVEL